MPGFGGVAEVLHLLVSLGQLRQAAGIRILRTCFFKHRRRSRHITGFSGGHRQTRERILIFRLQLKHSLVSFFALRTVLRHFVQAAKHHPRIHIVRLNFGNLQILVDCLAHHVFPDPVGLRVSNQARINPAQNTPGTQIGGVCLQGCFRFRYGTVTEPCLHVEIAQFRAHESGLRVGLDCVLVVFNRRVQVFALVAGRRSQIREDVRHRVIEISRTLVSFGPAWCCFGACFLRPSRIDGKYN